MGILAAGLDTESASASTGDGGAAAHLHGQSALFDVDKRLPARAAHLRRSGAMVVATIGYRPDANLA